MFKHFKHNFRIKIFSIIFAFIMWIYVMSEVDPIVIRSFENISIETVTNIDEIRNNGLTFAYGQNFHVKVDFRSTRSTLNEYIKNGVNPKGEIYDPKEGLNMMQIVMDSPKEIEYSINPLEIEVLLEKSIVMMKDIVINTEGNLKNDYVINKIKPSKAGLYVEGPQSQVQKVINLSGTLKLENNHEDFSTKINVVPLDEKNNIVEGVTIRDSSVIVDVNLSKTKEVPIKVVFVDDKNKVVENSSFKSTIENTMIQGSESMVDTVEYIKTLPIKVSSFNKLAGITYGLEKIDGIVFAQDKIKIKEIETDLEEYVIKVPKNDVSLIGDVLSQEIRQTLPEESEIKIIAGKEYSNRINHDNIRILINNKILQEQYKLLYEVDFPIFSINIKPDSIKMVDN